MTGNGIPEGNGLSAHCRLALLHALSWRGITFMEWPENPAYVSAQIHPSHDNFMPHVALWGLFAYLNKEEHEFPDKVPPGQYWAYLTKEEVAQISATLTAQGYYEYIFVQPAMFVPPQIQEEFVPEAIPAPETPHKTTWSVGVLEQSAQTGNVPVARFA